MLMNYLKRDPSGAMALVTALAAPICAALGRPELAPVLVAVAAAVLGLRTQVTPTAKAAETAAQAARNAATVTATMLEGSTVGPAGQVTDEATAVINNAVAAVTGALRK